MSRDEVLAEFEIDFEKSISDKGGEYLYADINKRAKKLILVDRMGVVETSRYWFSLRKEPYTMLAVDLIEKLQIKELKPELEILRKEIESGKVFLPYYNEWVDKALSALAKDI